MAMESTVLVASLALEGVRPGCADTEIRRYKHTQIDIEIEIPAERQIFA